MFKAIRHILMKKISKIYCIQDRQVKKDSDKKVNYMKKNSLLVDDSFSERKDAIENDLYAYGLENIILLIGDQV